MERAYIQYIFLLLATAVVFTAGLWIHSFIVAVNIFDCRNRRAMTAADQILFSVGLARLTFNISCLGDLLCTIILQSFLQIDPMHAAVRSIVMLSNYCSLCFSTLLSLVFFLKISIFKNVFISRLKSFVLQNIVLLLCTSLLFSILYTILGSWWYNNELLRLEVNSKMNVSQTMQLSLVMQIYYITGNAVPFFISAISVCFLLKNLCLHLTRMKDNIATHLDTYYTAIRCTTSCFVSYTLHIISSLLLMNYYYSIDIIVFHLIVNFFPAVHSAYLISITTRLRQQFSRLVNDGRKCLFKKRRDKINNSTRPCSSGLTGPTICNETISLG
ncbi:taste receptor type 2 member 9-like [Anomaloglossus baeobatrachus]|uniref:taste receptor type 2 member 9-like n=1 Tax=Anomaloglossus baeobatrachus TaxID=238106 RepID=UPI003F50ACBD